MLEAWASYIQEGGFVMPPLLVGTLALWFCLGWRVITLRRGTKMPLRGLLALHQSSPDREAFGIIARAAQHTAVLMPQPVTHFAYHLEEAFLELEVEMSRFSTLARSIVAVAPLTGLLGTVSGMIETFDSLASMTLFSQSGGIAGGISQALITTQMGLVIAIPGLIFGRILDRKQALLTQELDALKHLAMHLRQER